MRNLLSNWNWHLVDRKENITTTIMSQKLNHANVWYLGTTTKGMSQQCVETALLIECWYTTGHLMNVVLFHQHSKSSGPRLRRWREIGDCSSEEPDIGRPLGPSWKAWWSDSVRQLPTQGTIEAGTRALRMTKLTPRGMEDKQTLKTTKQALTE